MVAGINHYGIFFKLWIEDSRSIGAAQGRVKRKLRNQILRTEICQYKGGKKFKQHGKGARQTSLVVLFILSSYIKTMQKLKQLPQAATSWCGALEKVIRKHPLGGKVFSKKLLIKTKQNKKTEKT